MPTQKKQPGFEEALARLESIVKDMESGTMNLEDMIKRFEEGQKLIGHCTKTLNEVERRIEILVKKGDQVEAQPFEDATPGAPVPADTTPPPDEGELF